MRKVAVLVVTVAFLLCASRMVAEVKLIEVSEDFSKDPGWIGINNRLVGTDMPVVEQQFGWAPTNHLGAGEGEIGGVVTNSRHQAFYAMPIARALTLNDKLSASGKLALKRLDLRGVAYFGFFNQARHQWRVWNSMAFRVWEEDRLGQVMFDWMSADWQAAGLETDVLIKPDGTVHTWRFEYDPDASPDVTRRDALLEQILTDRAGNSPGDLELQDEPEIYKKAKAIEPDLTAEAFRDRLVKAREAGLVAFFHRHGQRRWWKVSNAEQYRGRVLVQIDDAEPHITYLLSDQQNQTMSVDRFGLFNVQRYGGACEIYFGDLTINGKKIDLSQDPHWEGRNNRVTYTEPDFHSMHNFGFAETNWAGGESPGEIGGLFWRVEPHDIFAYYADDVGELTFDDPISFSGWINFVAGQTDATMYFGYFNHDEQVEHTRDNVDGRIAQSMGITIADTSAVGYNFSGNCHSRDRVVRAGNTGPVFTPTGKPHRFTFKYDPSANDNVGRVTYTLDDQTITFDLKPEMRKIGATLNRFGLANHGGGGNSVTVYLDDLTYTARRDPTVKPAFHTQETVKVRYPKESGGRK